MFNLLRFDNRKRLSSLRVHSFVHGSGSRFVRSTLFNLLERNAIYGGCGVSDCADDLWKGSVSIARLLGDIRAHMRPRSPPPFAFSSPLPRKGRGRGGATASMFPRVNAPPRN